MPIDPRWCATVFCLATSLVSSAQSPTSSPQSPTYEERTKQATAWQRVAVRPVTGPSTSDIQAADAYFDQVIGNNEPIDEPHKERYYQGRSEGVPTILEFPSSYASAVIVGQFSTYKTHISGSHRSIYTELDIKPASVVKPGATTDGIYRVFIEGGTVLLPNASGVPGTRAVSYGIPRNPYSLMPDTQYLLFLRYEPNGHFYTVLRSWRVANGKLEPNNLADDRSAAAGHSLHTQMSIENASQEIREKARETTDKHVP